MWFWQGLFLFGTVLAVAAAAAVGAGRLVIAEGAFGQAGEFIDAFVDHIPEAVGQVIPVAAVNLYAFEAISVMGAGFGAMLSCFYHIRRYRNALLK